MGLSVRTAVGTLFALMPLFCTSALASPPGTVSVPDARLTHARELLGKHYKRSIVRAGESIDDISAFVHQAVARRMKREPAELVREVTDTILDESRKLGFDPLLIVAVIERESSFRPRVRGGVGEVGLMQIRPSTGRWLAEREGVEWKGDETLLDPITNIRLGARYIAGLREELSADGRLYLGAYNMGIGNVQNLLKRNRLPKIYPLRIMRSYVQLYAELKENIDSLTGGASGQAVAVQ